MSDVFVPEALAREACRALDVGLPVDPDGIAALYRAWCGQVPFDSIMKNVAMREGTVPPGDDPVEVIERWLATGVGSTCWGHCSAFTAIVRASGATATIGLERMRRDDVVDFHSFVVVTLDDAAGTRWLCDPVHPSGDPLELRAGARGNHPVVSVSLDADVDGPDPDRLVHTPAYPPRCSRSWPYGIVSTSLDRADVVAFCTLAARFSGLTVGRLIHRREPAAALISGSIVDGNAVEISTYRAAGDGPADVDEAQVERYDDLDEGLAALGYRSGAHALLDRAGFLGRT